MTVGGGYFGEAYPGGEPATSSSGTGTAAGSLGGIAGNAAHEVDGSAAGTLGSLIGATAGVRTLVGTATGAFGPLTGTAAGTGIRVGTATGSLGSIDGSSAGLGHVDLPLLDFAHFEVLTPAAVLTPVLIGADHVQWGFSTLEGEAQDGGGP